MLQNLDIGPGFYVFIGALFGIIIGWLIGFFDSNMRTAKKIQAAEAKSEEIIKEAEKKIVDAQAKVPAATVITLADDPGLLRLKNEDGHFAIEMDGAPITEALSTDKRKRLIELITVFRPWLEGGQSVSQAVPQPSVPVQVPSTPTPLQSALSSLQPLAQPLIPPKKPAEEKDIRSLSIVAQIDTVLQMRLVETPLATKGIRLAESLTGGVEVYVGINKYPSIDDVPDQEIKDTIRAAIAEWEQKYTPGM
jgi:hypothetical protein